MLDLRVLAYYILETEKESYELSEDKETHIYNYALYLLKILNEN
jgi:hypothetical protein